MDIIKAPIESVQNLDPVVKLQKNIQLLIEESEQLTVVATEVDLNTASLYYKKFGTIGKDLESVRKQIVKPLTDAKKTIDDFFKAISQLKDGEESRIKGLIENYLRRLRQLEEAKKAKEAEERRREEAKRAEERKLAEQQGIEVEEEPQGIEIEVVERQEKLSDKNIFGVTSQRKKTFQVVDLDKVPREYLMLDEKKIADIRKNYDFEVKEEIIPGIKFTFEETVRR